MSVLSARRQLRPKLSKSAESFSGPRDRDDEQPESPDRPIRLEDRMEDGYYVIRAELPGIDPARDVDVTVRDGRLTIRAERTEVQASGLRSEFCYGSFARSVTLPAGADEEDISASYEKGILTVSVAVGEPPVPVERYIAVLAAG